jgi:arylsulfatase A-like enzyme
MKKLILIAALLLLVPIFLHSIYSFRRYNVILITIDTLRADYVHCYNPGAAPSPAIDRIAANGVLFSNAFTLIPITMPSHTSILTSRQPYELGLFNNGDRFDHRVPMISDLLKKKGYDTAAFVSLGVLNRAFGLARGFDFYDDNFEKTNGRFYKTAAEMNAEALPWIEKHRDHPFFAWIHYSDPHEPYVSPDAPPDTAIHINGKEYLRFTLAKKERINLNFIAHPGKNLIQFQAIDRSIDSTTTGSLPRRFIDPHIQLNPSDGMELNYGSQWIDLRLRNGQEIRYFEEQTADMKLVNHNSKPASVQVRFSGGVWEERVSEVRKNYAGEVRYADSYIGRLWDQLSAMNLLDRTIIVVTADHGEGLKTHGLLGHVDMLWNETTRVPLLVYYPHLGYRGKRVDRLVNLLDIMPTILDLLHVSNKQLMEGRSLKYDVSRSPFDRWMSSPVNREWTYACTFSPEAAHDSFSITNGKWKVVHTPGKRLQWEAYDLIHDPIEKRNLARLDPQKFSILTTMRSLLETHRGEAQLANQKRKNPQLNAEEEEMLRNLGYVGGNGNEH